MESPDGNKSVIDSLTSTVQALDHSFSIWNRIGLYLVAGTALVATLYFIASYITNKKAQHLAVAQAALLKAKEDEFSLQIATLANETALARKDAAEATEKAEREHLARVRIEARLAPRYLSPEGRRSLVAVLKPFAGGRFWVVAETNDYDKGSEQLRFAEQLSAVLVEAGWIKDGAVTKTPLPIYRRVTSRGVEVGYSSGKASDLKVAQTLVAGLAAANIDSVPVAFTDIETGLVINVGLR